MLNHIIVTTRPIIIEEPLVSPAHKRNIYYKSCDFLFLLFAGNKIDVGDQCFQTLIDFAFFIFFSFIYVRVVSTTQSDSNHCENSYFATITVKNTFFRIIAAKNLYIYQALYAYVLHKQNRERLCLHLQFFFSRCTKKKLCFNLPRWRVKFQSWIPPLLQVST
jgi:hypothetical protein